MDFSGVLLIPLSALVTAVWIVMSALMRKVPALRGPFLLSYAVGLILAQPWQIRGWNELGMVLVMLVLLALWIAAGCIIGAMPAMVAVALGRKFARSNRD